MNLKIRRGTIILFLFLLPLVSEASSLAEISTKFLGGVNTIAKFLFGLGIVYFLYGLFSYTSGVDEKKKKEAKDKMVYGIIGLFVLTSVWGIVAVVRSAIGI